MTRTYHAADVSFATATGRNVRSGAGTSTFDDAPSTTRALTIAAAGRAGRAGAPCGFAPGERYDIGFRARRPVLLRAARVIRNDCHAGSGAVVFDGTDEGGTPVQVIWTPDFDLERWYWDNAGPNGAPLFHTGRGAKVAQVFGHVAAGTRIGAPHGPVPVQYLQAGLPVATRDSGARPVLWLGERRGPGIGPAAPVVFEIGAIGNTRRLLLSQRHRVLIAHPLAELYFGLPEVFVPAAALANGRDIRIEPRPRIRWFSILLDRHEVLTADGVPAESLFLGDVTPARLPGPKLRDVALLYPELAGWTRGTGVQTARPVLSGIEARFLAAAMGIARRPAKALSWRAAA